MEVHLNTYGSYLRKKDEMFELSIEDRKTKLSPEKISSIVISNAAIITTDAIQLAMDYNIDIVFLDKYGSPYGRIWFPKIGSTVLIRRRQLEMLSDNIGLQFIKNMAREANVKYLTFSSHRPGWERRAKAYGFRPRKWISEV